MENLHTFVACATSHHDKTYEKILSLQFEWVLMMVVVPILTLALAFIL
jgi:hypothetical protein